MRLRELATVLMLIPLSAAAPVSAGSAHMVVDLSPGAEPFSPGYSTPVFRSYTPVNGRVIFLTFFREQWDIFQCGLWATDGTAGGTERLTELCAGLVNADDRLDHILGTTGAVAFFTDGSGLLWRTDGTAGGTFRLGEVRVPVADFSDDGIPPSAAVGRTFYFVGCTRALGCEPWRSDGTRHGTKPVLDVARHRGASSDPAQFAARPGGGVLFSAANALWSSDGTEGGTVELFPPRGYLGDFLVKGSAVYLTSFPDNGAGDAGELWVIDLATRKRRLLETFAAYTSHQFVFAEAGGRLFFSFDWAYLWETDGTAAGTRQLGPPFELYTTRGRIWSVGGRAVIPAAREGAAPSVPDMLDLWVVEPAMKRPHQLQGCPEGCPRVSYSVSFMSFENRLFFPGWDAAHGFELWQTDGTAQGTRLVKDLSPGPGDGSPAVFRTAPGRLLFEDGHLGLWVTDGTPAGTVRIASTSGVTPPVDFAAEDGHIVFTGVDPGRGPQPMVSDLSPEGTQTLLPFGSVLAVSSTVSSLTRLGAEVLFSTYAGNEGDVWMSDGTETGTRELPVAGSDFIGLPVSVGNSAYFNWDRELWRTDGTPGGTVELLDTPDDWSYMAAMGGKLLFERFPRTPDGPIRKFWTSDGTPQGTQEAFQKRLLTAPGFGLTSAGDEAYFSGRRPGGAPALYRTDGTAEGTRPILRGEPFELVRLNGKVYFIAKSPGRQQTREIWMTDGTAAGTSPLLPDLAAPHPVDLEDLAVFKGELYFFSTRPGRHAPVGLWRSDGTAAGTRLVSSAMVPPLEPGRRPQEPPPVYLPFYPGLTAVGDTLFFQANEGIHGEELWKTDGTAAGTVLVRDIAPGAATSRLRALTAAGGKLYFTATDVEHGMELWESDGTAAGTRLVNDIQPGTGSSLPDQLTPAGGRLFFTANDGEHGRELWVLPLQP